MRRSDWFEEPESLRRGSRRSCFLSKENQNSGESKANKSLYTYTMANEFKNFGEHFRDKDIGDSATIIQEQRPKQQEEDFQERNSKISKSKTVVVNHFGKLKKKNEEGLKKFHDIKSKNIEIHLINKSIEKIQSKIDEFSKAIQSMAPHDEKSEISEKKLVVEQKSASVNEGDRLSAVVAAMGLIIILLFLLYLFEGASFFNFTRHFQWKSPKPSSMLNWIAC